MTAHDSAATACRKRNQHSAATMAKICCTRMAYARFLEPEKHNGGAGPCLSTVMGPHHEELLGHNGTLPTRRPEQRPEAQEAVSQ